MNVVLLLGPSSAGKSTICNELEAQGWTVTGIDLTMESIDKERIASYHKKFREKDLYNRLSPYMSAEDIERVCLSGELNIVVGSPPVKQTFYFSSPDYLEAEEFLRKAGLTDENEIKRLAEALREVGQVEKNTPRPDGVEKLFDQAFDPSLDNDANVVIDMVPESTPEKTLAMIRKFEERAGLKTHGRTVKTSIVLAVCPLDKHSKRILKRNEEARANKKPGEERLGSFAFDQSACLMQAKVQEKNPLGNMHAEMGEVSRGQLMIFAYQHRRPVTGSPMLPSKDGSERKVASKISQQDALKVSDNIEGKRLASKFGLQNNEPAALEVRPEFKPNAIINTTAGTPKENADLIIKSIEQDKKFHFFNK